jgi:hypothetical protein
MRERSEIVNEIHEARRDLATNLDALRDAVEEKLDVGALLERGLEPLAAHTRAKPKLMFGIAAAAGAVFALLMD